MGVMAETTFGVRPLADRVINAVLLTASENWSQVVPTQSFGCTTPASASIFVGTSRLDAGTCGTAQITAIVDSFGFAYFMLDVSGRASCRHAR